MTKSRGGETTCISPPTPNSGGLVPRPASSVIYAHAYKYILHKNQTTEYHICVWNKWTRGHIVLDTFAYVTAEPWGLLDWTGLDHLHCWRSMTWWGLRDWINTDDSERPSRRSVIRRFDSCEASETCKCCRLASLKCGDVCQFVEREQTPELACVHPQLNVRMHRQPLTL